MKHTLLSLPVYAYVGQEAHSDSVGLQVANYVCVFYGEVSCLRSVVEHTVYVNVNPELSTEVES